MTDDGLCIGDGVVSALFLGCYDLQRGRTIAFPARHIKFVICNLSSFILHPSSFIPHPSPLIPLMLLLIRPSAFALNAQTAVNNYFQPQTAGDDARGVHKAALAEFDGMVHQLRAAEIDIVVVQDTPEPHTPDSIFPNNWVSFHEDGHVLYPMYAANRRLERKLDIWPSLPAARLKLDLSEEENHGRFLEGTGSLVLDRTNRIAYAALSERTHEPLVKRWCDVMGYTAVMFNALQTVGHQRLPIYHTNVMMSVGKGFALWCPDCIDDASERSAVEQSLRSAGKELIAITESQMHGFAGNILQVYNRNNEPFILMSSAAERSLQGPALDALSRHGRILACAIPTIEKYGGGSARCMVAELTAP